MAVKNVIEAVREALQEEMRRDPDIFVMGEDVGKRGGVFLATQGLMDEFGESRVIDTPLAHSLAGDEGGPIREQLESRTPLGRPGAPSDIAGLISFLVGPDADFMTGSYLVMDGGIRDAGRIPGDDPTDRANAERMQHAAITEARNARMQPLIDQR